MFDGVALRSLGALLRFQWTTGVRLSWRVLTSTIVPVLAILYLLGPETVAALGRFIIERHLGTRILLLCLLAAGIGSCQPRIHRGTAQGWIAHLPLTLSTRRRALVLSNALASLPLALCVLLLGLAAGATLETVVHLTLGVGLALLGLSLGTPPLRKQQWVVVLLGVFAAVCALTPQWGFLAAGFLLLLIADRFAGPLEVKHQTSPKSSRLRVPMELLLMLRALGPRISGGYLAASLPLLAGLAFLVNNELSVSGRQLGAILAGGLGSSFLISSLVDSIRTRRPPWPWSRTLPWSARQRCLSDALFLMISSLPIWGLTLSLEVRVGLPLAALLAFQSILGSLGIRGSSTDPTGGGGEVLAVAALSSALVAVLPWIGSAICLIVSPLLFRSACSRERRLPVSRWNAATHLSVGDTLEAANP